jgi:two-component system NarL family sensor kinase
MELLNITNNNITIFVSIAIAVMLLLIISFLLAFNTSQRKKFQYHQNLLHLKESQQNELIKAAVRSEEIERHRISEELHDEVGAILSATKLYLGNMHPETLQKADAPLYTKSLELLDESIEKIRSISHNLHSAILKELGLNEAIKSFIQKISQSDNLKVTIELNNYISQNPDNDISVYRIIQELCNNIIKHSHATELNIRSNLRDGKLVFQIRHNGKGLTQQQFEKLRYESKGLGLKNIQNRIILLKGEINFTSQGNNHTIQLRVPLNNAA